MTARSLHADWPPLDPAADRWDVDEPTSDLIYALDASPDFGTATAPSQPIEGFQVEAVAEIVRYSVSYHGETWTPTNEAGGSELNMYLVGRLTDGRWFSLVAGNDYTGWGCQDYSDVRIGDSEEQVVTYGLDQAGRQILGYEGGAA